MGSLLFRKSLITPQHRRLLGFYLYNHPLKNYSALATTKLQRRKDVQIQSGNFHLMKRSFSYTETVTEIWKFLSNSTPVSYIQKSLLGIHDFTGLPWWATIILTTFLFRTAVTLPLTIYQHKITGRIEKIALEMPDIAKELKKEMAIAVRRFNWSEKEAQFHYARSLRKQWNNLIVRDNCHPMKTLIVLWGQIPLWIFQSVAIRNLVLMLPDPSSLEAQITFTELTIGGFGWIPNLTEIDQSFILPISLGVINLSIIEIQSRLRVRQSTRMQKFATNAFRGISILMVPIAASVPSCLCLYWMTSSSYGLIQNLLIASPSVRRSLGIPQTKSELPNPYQHLLMSIQNPQLLSKTLDKNTSKGNNITSEEEKSKKGN